MHHDLQAIQRGWAVYDANDEKLGDVADIGSTYLLVQKGLLFIKDLYIPTSAITETDQAQGRVYLNVAKGDVDAMGWEEPPTGGADLTGAGMTTDRDQTTGRDRTDFDYGVTATERAGTAGGNLSGAVMEEADARVTLHEEELQAETHRAQAGEVQVSKRVVEDQQELEVPLTHDEVQVRRVRVDREATADDAAFTQDADTIRVPITAETVEVRKTPRVVEEIEISKRPVTERRTVRDTVRREEADISRQGDVVMGDAGAPDDAGMLGDRSGDRSGDLVGAGADRFERTSVDDIAGLDTATGGRRIDTDDDVRDIDRA
ncbi:MAG TPA: DUF2382 domain-containing protein [Candidatus Limnocylindrales bacterium]|nr:DUF2382 domain-containing protein [Candidatus Limnocylindrales bacterium]